jgi:putative transport protein
MDWLKVLFTGDTIAQAVLILSLVSALGFFIGSIRVYGISLGIAGVLFSGLLFGHYGLRINTHVLEFAREFGLILFVYTIGVQVGPGFLASLRKQGLPLNLMAFSIVLLGALVTLAIFYLGGINMEIAVGLFSGATTNTPALGAAQQALKGLPSFTEEMGKMPGLGYAVAYPFGIMGIILTMGLVRLLFRISPANESLEFAKQQQANIHKVLTLNLTVTNANLNGVTIKQIPGLTESGVVISRIFKSKEVKVAKPDSIINTGDTILAVGPQDKLEEIRMVIGEVAMLDLKSVPSHVMTQRVIVTRKDVLGKAIEDLDLDGTHGVKITRINRGEIEFTPTPGFDLKFGDAVIVVGDESGIQRASAQLGNSSKFLNHPQVVPIFVGIALGILVGSWPVQFPSMPAPVKLGLAGGPLLAAIFLSRLGRIGPIIWYMPQSANFILRELGITLFLSCVGLKAGDKFIETLTTGPGLVWMGYAALITLVPLLIVGIVARAAYKTNYMTLCGVLAGSMTDPPALAFANTITSSDAPSVSYATVYPLTMLLRVLTAQILVLFFMK